MAMDDLLSNPPENIEDISTVESAVSELEQVYNEMKTALEKEEKERAEKLKKKMIKPIVALMKAGYSEEMIKRGLRGMGVKEDIISELMVDAWEIIENRGQKKRMAKRMEIAVIVGAILILVVGYFMLVGSTKPNQCHSFGCSTEISQCQTGKYITNIGTIEKEIIIQKSNGHCLVSERVISAKNSSIVGKYLNCRFPIIDGITDTSNKNNCEGTLKIETAF